MSNAPLSPTLPKNVMPQIATPTFRSATSQVDTIVYLASLASRPDAIDHILERMRVVTALMGPDGQLSNTDKQTLAGVQHDLEQYLIQQEPLRRFTAETLQRKLAEHARGVRTPGIARMVWIWLAISGLLLIMPFVAFPHISLELKQLTSSISVPTGLCLGAGWFLINSVRDFRAELRNAYRYLAIGVVLFGLAMLSTPMRTFLNDPDIEWRHLETAIIPFFIAHLPMYIGVRTFTRQLGIKTILTSPLLLIATMLVGGALIVIAPHVPTYAQELYFDISVVSLVWCAILAIMGIAMMYFIAGHIGDLYARPMRWLLAGYIMITLASLLFLGIRFTVGYLPPGILQLLSYTPTLCGSILLFIAATKFKRANTY